MECPESLTLSSRSSRSLRNPRISWQACSTTVNDFFRSFVIVHGIKVRCNPCKNVLLKRMSRPGSPGWDFVQQSVAVNKGFRGISESLPRSNVGVVRK